MRYRSNRLLPHFKLILFRYLIVSLMLLPAACTAAPTPEPTPTPIPLAKELVFYDWDDDIPQSVLDAFTAEYGVKVRYEAYASQEEAVGNIRAGQVHDVVVLESRFIPLLVNEGLLAEINYKNVTNFKNILPNFRELAYDPDSLFSIPYGWGTIGLVVRTDLAQSPITRWDDLWDTRYAGKVALWSDLPRETLALTLKSLGYSANSENPVELEAALTKLIALKPDLRFLNEFDSESAAPALASGDVIIAMGYTGDLLVSQNMGLPVEYILPEEGTILWGDTFVIPANSPNRYSAELFINFLLRPEISAEIVNQNYFATANEAAFPLIEPDILNNPVIFPANQDLVNAELILPLTPGGQELYDSIWERFMAAP